MDNQENQNEIISRTEKFTNEYEYLQTEKPTKKKSILKFFRNCFILFTVFALGALVAYFISDKSNKVTVLSSEEANVVNAVSKAKDSVVSIVGYSSSQNNRFLQGQTGDELRESANGSGVIYKKESGIAYVVTNNHVIDNIEELEVVFSDGRKISAELVGRDIWTDLAVLKIDATYVENVIEFADSDATLVGQTALTIGSPLGVSLSNTVTQGIISANERQVPIDIDNDGSDDWYQTVIQTDAAINPGNSGGALINTSGQLIGINQLKISNVSVSVSAEGIGFVIPANEVKYITEQLEGNSFVRRPALGVNLVDLRSLSSQGLAQLDYDSNEGVIIRAIEENSAADQAGLEQYDIITRINDYDISTVADVRKYLFEETKIGDDVTIKFYRNGSEHTVNLRLGELQAN